MPTAERKILGPEAGDFNFVCAQELRPFYGRSFAFS